MIRYTFNINGVTYQFVTHMSRQSLAVHIMTNRHISWAQARQIARNAEAHNVSH